MSLVQGSTSAVVKARFDSQTTIAASGSVRQQFRARINGSTTIAASGGLLVQGAAVIAGSTVLEAFGRLNAGVNRYGSASFHGSTTLAARGGLKFLAHARFDGSTVFSAEGQAAEVDTAELPIIIDLAPNTGITTGARVQVLGARFKVDGSAVPIKSFRYNAPAGAAGVQFSATLTEPTPALVPIAGDFAFEVNIAGVWIEVFSGSFGSRSYAIAFAGDEVNISSIDDAADSLGKAPKAPTVFYDSAKIETLTEDKSEILLDTAGRTYPTTFTPTASLDLYKLFDYALKTIAGFANWKTNIPNFAIVRADFPIGRPAIETIRALAGMFEPLFFVDGSTIWIVDATLALPAGFTPRTIAASRFLAYQAETGQDAGNVDGLLVTYVESALGDFYTQRFEYDTETFGTEGNSDYIETSITRELWDYRNVTDPTTVLRTVLKKETKETKNYQGVTAGLEVSTFSFDSLGRSTGYLKTVDSLVPSLPSGALSLTRVNEERQRLLSSTNSIGQTRVYNRTTKTEGLVAIDSENPYFGAPFKQDFLEAHRAGNLSEAMSTEFAPIRTVIERFTYLNNGQTFVTSTVVDHLRGGVTKTQGDNSSGEGLIPYRQKTKRVIVWREGFDFLSVDPSQRQLREFNAGELPPKYCLPLAKRKLARTNAGKGSARVVLSGFDISIRRGSTFRIVNRDGSSLGDYLTLGFNAAGDNLGTPAANVQSELALLEL